MLQQYNPTNLTLEQLTDYLYPRIFRTFVNSNPALAQRASFYEFFLSVFNFNLLFPASETGYLQVLEIGSGTGEGSSNNARILERLGRRIHYVAIEKREKLAKMTQGNLASALKKSASIASVYIRDGLHNISSNELISYGYKNGKVHVYFAEHSTYSELYDFNKTIDYLTGIKQIIKDCGLVFLVVQTEGAEIQKLVSRNIITKSNYTSHISNLERAIKALNYRVLTKYFNPANLTFPRLSHFDWHSIANRHSDLNCFSSKDAEKALELMTFIKKPLNFLTDSELRAFANILQEHLNKHNSTISIDEYVYAMSSPNCLAMKISDNIHKKIGANKMPEQDLHRVFSLFEAHGNVVATETLQKELGFSSDKIGKWVTGRRLVRLEKGSYALSEKFLQSVQLKLPQGGLRLDKQSFEFHPSVSRIAAEELVSSKILARAKVDNLLVKQINFRGNRYNIEFFAARCTRLDEQIHIVFDGLMKSPKDLVRQARVWEGQGRWELGRYFRQLAESTPKRSYDVLTEIMPSLQKKYGDIEVTRVSENYHLMTPPRSVDSQTKLLTDVAEVRFDSKTNTYIFGESFQEGLPEQRSVKFSEAIQKIGLQSKEFISMTFKELTKKTLKILPIVGVGMSVHTVAKADEKVEAAIEETAITTGGFLGGLMMLPLVPAGIIGAPAVLGAAFAGGYLASKGYLAWRKPESKTSKGQGTLMPSVLPDYARLDAINPLGETLNTQDILDFLNQPPSLGDTILSEADQQHSKEQAKQFVEKRAAVARKPSASLPKSASHREQAKSLVKQNAAEDDALLDEVTKMMATAFSHDAQVHRLYETYQKSSNRPQAFVQFKQDYDRHLSVEKQRAQWLSVGRGVSIFCAQVAILSEDIHIGRTALGIGAGIQIYSGMTELGNTFELMASTSGLVGSGFSVATIGSGFAAANLVLGGFTVISSLIKNDNEENGMGMAMIIMNSNLVGMWEYMRRRDAVYFELMLSYKNDLGVHEANEMQRFEVTIHRIDDMQISLSVQIAEGQQTFYGKMTDVGLVLESYLKEIIDTPIKITIQNIKKMSSTQRMTQLSSLTSELWAWLTESATSDARTGRRKQEFGEMVVDDTTLTQVLRGQLAPERHPDDLPLGLYYNLVQEIMPDAEFSEISSTLLINPKDWKRVLDVYLLLINLGKDMILEMEHEPRQAYRDELLKIGDIIRNSLQFMLYITKSKSLWKKLSKNQQSQILGLKQQLEEHIVIERQKLNRRFYLQDGRELLRLDEHPTETIVRLNSSALEICSPDYLSAFVSERLTPEIIKIFQSLPEAQHTLKFFKTLEYYLANIYQQADIRVTYKERPSRNPEFYQSFEILFFLERPGEEPVSIARVVKEIIGRNEPTYQLIDYLFSLQSKEFTDVMEKRLLIPARRELIKDYVAETAMQILLRNFNLGYFKTAVFIKLIDPSFVPIMHVAAFQRIKTALENFYVSGQVAQWRALLSELHDNVWKEPFATYLGKAARNFTEQDLSQLMHTRLPHNPLWKELTIAQARVKQAEQMLQDYEDQDQYLNQLKQAAKIISEQQKTLVDARYALENSLLFLSEIEDASTVVAEFTTQLEQLKAEEKSIRQQKRAIDEAMFELLPEKELDFIDDFVADDFSSEAKSTAPRKVEEVISRIEVTSDAEKLKVMFAQLQESREKTQKTKKDLENQLAQSQQLMLSHEMHKLSERDFILGDQLMSDDDVLGEVVIQNMHQQAVLRANLLTLFETITAYIEDHYPQGLEKMLRPATAILQDLIVEREKSKASTAALQKIQESNKTVEVEIPPFVGRRLLSMEEDRIETSSAPSRYDSSWWSILGNLGRRFQNYWQPTIPTSSTRMPALGPTVDKRTSSSRHPDVTHNCENGLDLDQQPVKICRGQDYVMHVYSQPSAERGVIPLHGQVAPEVTADSAQATSCRPIAYFGAPSVVCKAKKTTWVYTPKPRAPLFANLDGNLMLGQVAWHLLKQVSVSPAAKAPPSTIITGKSLKLRLKDLERSIRLVEEQWAKLPLAQQSGLKFALSEHRDRLREIRDLQRATSEVLDGLAEDIAATQEEIQELLSSSKSPAPSIQAARSSASFFAPAPSPVDSGIGIGQLSPHSLEGSARPVQMLPSPNFSQ